MRRRSWVLLALLAATTGCGTSDADPVAVRAMHQDLRAVDRAVVAGDWPVADRALDALRGTVRTAQRQDRIPEEQRLRVLQVADALDQRIAAEQQAVARAAEQAAARRRAAEAAARVEAQRRAAADAAARAQAQQEAARQAAEEAAGEQQDVPAPEPRDRAGAPGPAAPPPPASPGRRQPAPAPDAPDDAPDDEGGDEPDEPDDSSGGGDAEDG